MSNDYVGATVTAMRPMTEEEMSKEYWPGEKAPICIELSNGAVIYPSRDPEGNGPGILFALDPYTGRSIAFYPIA